MSISCNNLALKNSGFTLIELLVVISIVGLLSSIVLAGLSSARDKGRIAAGLYFEDHIYHAIGDQMIGAWNFDDCIGTSVTDSSGGSHTGTFNNLQGSFPTWSINTPNNFKCAINFNGNADITTNLQQTSVNAYTIGAWVNTTSSDQQGVVDDRGVANDNGLSVTLIIDNLGHVGCFLEGSSIIIGGDSSKTINDGKWHYILCTFSSQAGASIVPSNFRVYVDGALAPFSTTQAYGSVSSPVTGSSDGTELGYHSQWVAGFIGLIDRVRIYNASF